MSDSSLKPVSNIMSLSKIKKEHGNFDINPYPYLPFYLLPDVYNDVRNENSLSAAQSIQKLKKLFKTECVLDDTT